MKIQLLGIAIILCGIAWILAYSYITPKIYDETTMVGLVITFIGLVITVIGFFKSKDK